MPILWETRSPSGRQSKRFPSRFYPMSFELIKIFLLSWVNKVEYGAETCLFLWIHYRSRPHPRRSIIIKCLYTFFSNIFTLNPTRRNIMKNRNVFLFPSLQCCLACQRMNLWLCWKLETSSFQWREANNWVVIATDW